MVGSIGSSAAPPRHSLRLGFFNAEGPFAAVQSLKEAWNRVSRRDWQNGAQRVSPGGLRKSALAILVAHLCRYRIEIGVISSRPAFWKADQTRLGRRAGSIPGHGSTARTRGGAVLPHRRRRAIVILVGSVNRGMCSRRLPSDSSPWVAALFSGATAIARHP